MILTFLLSSLALAAEPKAKTIWKQTYLYSTDGKAVGYYEETAENRSAEKQLAISQQWVEMENGVRTETFIGAVAKDDGQFTPVAFFSERNAGKKSYKIDGRAKGGTMVMNFKPTKSSAQAKQMKSKMKAGTILSNFVPLFLINSKGTKDFSAIVEDARDGNFETRSGLAEVMEKKKDFQGQACSGFRVTFGGVAGEWWVAEDGHLCEFTAGNSKLSLSTDAAAKQAVK